MPEGDTIHAAARKLSDALVGETIVSVEAPQPRHAMDRWPERLAGRAIGSVDARGKHLLVRFEGGVTLHSHLRMRGAWAVHAKGARWARSPHRAWLVLRTAAHDVVQFDGPVLELMADSRTRFDPRLAALGPDILAEDFGEQAFLARLREDDPTRGIGDAVLDQRNIAGIGNVWKSEGCFDAQVDPWRRVGDVSDEEALRIVRAARPRMQDSASRGGHIRGLQIYDRAGRPCPRCKTGRIRARARATPTGPPSGAPDASTEAGRAQGRRPRGARQYP